MTREALSSDAVAGQVRAHGLEIAASGPGRFDALVRAEAAVWPPLIRELGLRLDG